MTGAESREQEEQRGREGGAGWNRAGHREEGCEVWRREGWTEGAEARRAKWGD